MLLKYSSQYFGHECGIYRPCLSVVEFIILPSIWLSNLACLECVRDMQGAWMWHLQGMYDLFIPKTLLRFLKKLTLSLIQGMVDGSASKPALRQDTGYMVEKPYLDIAPYLGAFGAYLMPQ